MSDIQSEADKLDITDVDRARFRFMPDEAVRSHKYVHSQQGDRLKAAITFRPDGSVDWSNPVLVDINREAGASINWTVGTVAEALYDKKLIDERLLDRICDW